MSAFKVLQNQETGQAGPPTPIPEVDVSESPGAGRGGHSSNFQPFSPKGHSELEVFTYLIAPNGFL